MDIEVHETTGLHNESIKSILESLLFVNEKPISLDELCAVLEAPKKDIEAALQDLTTQYLSRNGGVCIVQVAGGYQMCSSPTNEPWIKKMYRERSKHKLTGPSLETLAIIAYKQPLARIEIEAIRGVNIDGVIRHLLSLGLIKTEGRKEVVGRPFLYVTTRKFLEYFGLNSLKDLPKLEEFTAIAQKDHLLQPAVEGEGGLAADQEAVDPAASDQNVPGPVVEAQDETNASLLQEGQLPERESS
jgi:segregation and condensation protein B